MFGNNQITGQKFFEQADEKLLVTSIFYTVQGEGPLMGRPSVFVRLSKCNLNCNFCDTYFDNGEWLSIKEIENKITEAITTTFNGDIPDYLKLRPNKRYFGNIALVITGGEPMLQKNIKLLTDWGVEKFDCVQIESNGILFQDIAPSTVLVVSPKCSEKTNKYIKPHAKSLKHATALKFVISADPSSPYHTIPDWAFDWKKEVPRSWREREIFISPMNVYNKKPSWDNQNLTLEQRSTISEKSSFWDPGVLNLEENKKNHEYVGSYALKHNLRVNLQMQIYLGMT